MPRLFIVRLPSFATLSINGDSPFVRIFHLQQIIETDVFIVFWLTSRLTFFASQHINRTLSRYAQKEKSIDNLVIINASSQSG